MGFINAIFADSFDDISNIPTFVLTPLIYLGGVFYSINILPDIWRNISMANPMLYVVNTFREGMLGVSDVSIPFALGMIIFFIIILTSACYFFFIESWNSSVKVKYLGRQSNPKLDSYSADFLDAIPRNNEHLDCFFGLDYWNAYEFSYLNSNNHPVIEAIEIKISMHSILTVESKSLKLFRLILYNKKFKDPSRHISWLKMI